MELTKIIFIVIVVGVIGFILFRSLVWDRIKGRQNKKQSDSSEPKEK